MFLERCMWLCLIGMCLNQYSTSGASGQYSTKSAYEAFFVGAIHFRPWERIRKSWAPGKCKFFMWTAAHKKCWTAECLAKKGLPHPALCPLCDQVEETLDHLLVSCVFVSFGSACCRAMDRKHLPQDWMMRSSMIGGTIWAAGCLVRSEKEPTI